MNRHLRTGLVAAAALAALATFATPAQADKRIVVLNVDGAKTSKLRRSLENLIRDQHALISAVRYERAAIKLSARSRSPANVARVAAEIQVDGVIESTLTRKKKRYYLKVRLRAGVSGLVVWQRKIRLKRPRLTSKIERNLAELLLPAIAELPEIDEDFLQEDDPAEPADAAEVVMVREDGAVVAAPARAVDSRARRGPLDLRAGVSMTGRTLAFTSREGLANPPPDYSSPLAPSVYLRGALYPLAIDRARRGVASKLGIGFVVERAIGYEDQVDDQTVPIAQNRLGVDIRLRHSFGTKATQPTLVASVGYNRLAFEIDPADVPDGVMLDLPNSQYEYINPGVAVRFPLTARIALTASAHGLIFLDAGEITQGEQFGTATLTGLDTAAGVEFLVTPRVAVALDTRFMLIGFEFNGDGLQSTERDGDPDTVDVGGASDRYLGLALTAGYLF